MGDAAKEISFDDIITPIDSETFFKHVHRERPAHIEGPEDKFSDAFGWDELNAILNQNGIWSARTLQLVLDTIMLPPKEYASPRENLNGENVMWVDLDRVRKHIKRGATLILNDVATLSSGISNLTNALSQTPGGKVSCNIYCSWQAHQGLDIHFDCHDVFAIQIAGRKRWNVFQRYFQDPINHPAFRQLGQDFHNRNCGPVSLDVTMTPGDLIYIPSGYYHAAMAESEASLHLTFSVVHPIGLDLITAVYERAIYDDLFRRAIPHPSVDNGKKTEQHLVQLAGRFRELVRDEEFQEAFINKLRDFKYETHPLTLPQDAYEDE